MACGRLVPDGIPVILVPADVSVDELADTLG